MTDVLERPDMEGAWRNIGGPERLKPTDVTAVLSRVSGREIRYDPCTPAESAELLVKALGDSMPEENRAPMAASIADFYHYNTIRRPNRSRSIPTICSGGCRKWNSRRWNNGPRGRTGPMMRIAHRLADN